MTKRQPNSISILLILIGLFHILNGLFMIWEPASWYVAVPGVTASGPYNFHFITDIGLAFAASGALLALGARAASSAAGFALAGATFPFLHALFHVALWFAHGFPHGLALMASEYVGVALLSFLGMALAILRAGQEGMTRSSR